MDKNLLFGSLGNGITVFDKTVQDNGDLKKIANISKSGEVKYYVSLYNLPWSYINSIEYMAEMQKEKLTKSYKGLSPLIFLF